MSISTQEYLERNMNGFESDYILRDKVKAIVKKYGIDCIIETGTYMGATTKVMAEWVKQVITIEANYTYLDSALKYLDGEDNVHCVHGDSSKILKDYIISDSKSMFWLDAHWQGHCPLLDELRQIADSGTKPVIAIHDFKVPDHPELGYDSYNGQDLDYGYIQAGLEAIYGVNGYTYEYNTKASEGSAARGCIFVYPKK